MNIDKKLKQWLDAELIDFATAERIRHFEQHNSRPLFLYAISGIGALSLCLGFISLVAANWHNISPTTKLVLDILVGCGLSGYLLNTRKTAPKWVTELLIALLCGWTLASIALIGQIYQLSGDGKSAITMWTILVTPLLLQGRSTLSGVILLGALSMTYGAWAEYSDSKHMVAIIPGLTLGILGLSIYQPLAKKRPEIAAVFSFATVLSILGAATIIPNSFYAKYSGKDLNYIIEALLLSLPGLLWVWSLLKAKANSLQLALFASVLCTFVPILIPHGRGLDLFAILFFLGYWSLVAKASFDMGHITLFRLATFAVAARLIIMYFELVGTLLNTGLLFLSGGLLILLVTRFWYTKQQSIIGDLRSSALIKEVTPTQVEQEEKDTEQDTAEQGASNK